MRVVFFLGTGRCGSTLLHDCIARHPGVGFVSNVDDRLAPFDLLGRWNSQLYRCSPGWLTRVGRRSRVKAERLRFGPSEAYNLLARQVSPILVSPTRDLVAEDLTPWLHERVWSFFEQRASAQRCDAFVHKLTGWPRARFLDAALDDARFVHIVRDGRAVSNSWLQTTWWEGYEGPERWQWGPLPESYARDWERTGRSFVALAGLLWKTLIDAYDDAQRTVPSEAWLQVRFEDVVADPERELTRIVDFAGLDAAPATVSRGLATLMRGQRQRAFEQELTATQVELLDELLHGPLRRLGYVP